jgi:hypothetical protein
LDAYLEEELYDLLTYCIQNRQAPEFAHKKCRVQEIGRELYADSGADALENMFFSIERGVKEEMGQEVRPYRAWWNGIRAEWKYKDHFLDFNSTKTAIAPIMPPTIRRMGMENP